MGKHKYVERADPNTEGYEPGTRRRSNVVNRYKWANEWIHGTVLDVPCGMGWGTPFLKKAERIIGIDIDVGAITVARNWYLHAAFYEGNMLNIDFPDSFFDSVICCEGYEHVTREGQYRLMKELHRVVKPGGRVLLTIPIVEYKGAQTDNPYHVYEPTLTEVMDSFEEKFDVVDFKKPNVARYVLEALK